MRRSSPHGLAVVLIALLSAGCTPTCERTCRKMLDCGTLESDRVSVVECEASCERQLNLYTGWDDEQELDDAIDAHRRCLRRATCDEIEAGECYDERLFPVGLPESELSPTGSTASTGS